MRELDGVSFKGPKSTVYSTLAQAVGGRAKMKGHKNEAQVGSPCPSMDCSFGT